MGQHPGHDQGGQEHRQGDGCPCCPPGGAPMACCERMHQQGAPQGSHQGQDIH
jgi:hypothetical protein